MYCAINPVNTAIEQLACLWGWLTHTLIPDTSPGMIFSS